MVELYRLIKHLINGWSLLNIYNLKILQQDNLHDNIRYISNSGLEAS